MSETPNVAPELDLNEVMKVRREKLANLVESGNNPFEITKYEVTAKSVEIKADESYLDKKVSVAGRIMSRRIMGKASFFHINDGYGTLQLYIRRDDVGEDAYAAFKKYDIGDIVGVEGFVFTTKTGEISVHTEKITLLSKSL